MNVAIGLAKLNHTVSIAGRIADDINGQFIRKECLRNGVDISRVILGSVHKEATTEH